MPTLCENCIHVHPESPKERPYMWLCSKHKRLEGKGFVTAKDWVINEPFLRCKDVNGGACPLYEVRDNDKGNAPAS